MKQKSILQAAVFLLVLLIALFLIANQLVGSGSLITMVDVARAKCVQAGYPVQVMKLGESAMDSGIFGFGGSGRVVFIRDGRMGQDGKIVEFSPDGKRIPLEVRVELRRVMNLMEWDAVNVVEGKGQ